MRPKKLRFCTVVVVIGAGVKPGVVPGVGEDKLVSAGDGVGEGPNRLSCARTAEPVQNRIKKMMAGRIIDRLNTKTINRL